MTEDTRQSINKDLDEIQEEVWKLFYRASVIAEALERMGFLREAQKVQTLATRLAIDVEPYRPTQKEGK